MPISDSSTSVSTPTAPFGGSPTANMIAAADGVALSPIELKAISVPQSLLFLLSSEYDMFLCITTVGIKNSFKMVIKTRLAPSYRLLLESGARRFGLSVQHTESESIVIANGSTTHMPLLRYVDYIPGGLHVDELLDCFGVNTKNLPRKAKPFANVTKESNLFEACFVDYSPYTSDETLHDVHGCGFYLTLDYGLNLATHAHLLHVTFLPDRKLETAAALAAAGTTSGKNGRASTSNASYSSSLANFLKFSGWEKLDLRFDDESKKSAVVVLPTTQDANDLLEKYENEESDNEIEDLADPTIATAAAFRPQFHIRPIAPTVSVPFIEDSTLRKLRAQHWDKIESFWTRSVVNKNSVTVSNLYDGVVLEEIIKLFGCSVLSAAMVEDDSPAKRRRAFITFATSEDTKEALGLDGKNTRGKSLKIHTAPPYIDTTRRGKTIASKGLGASALMPHTPAGAGSAAPTPSPAGHDTSKSPGLNVSAKEFVPKFSMTGNTFALPPPYAGAAPPSSSPPAVGAPALPPAYNGAGGSPLALAALPPAYTPAASSSTVAAETGRPAASVSPIGDGAAVGAMPPAYALPPPYAGKQPPPPHPQALPPPAYTPSPKSPESPVSQVM